MTASTHPWKRPAGTSGSVDPDAADFGYAIEELRTACGWSRAEVGRRARSMAYSTVAGIENGHRPPSKRTMGPLAQGLLVNREDLEELWRLFEERAGADAIDPVWRRLLEQAQADADLVEPIDPPAPAPRGLGLRKPSPGGARFASYRAAPRAAGARSEWREPDILELTAESDPFGLEDELEPVDVDDASSDAARRRRATTRVETIDRLMKLANALPHAQLDTALAVIESLTEKARADGTLRD